MELRAHCEPARTIVPGESGTDGRKEGRRKLGDIELSPVSTTYLHVSGGRTRTDEATKGFPEKDRGRGFDTGRMYVAGVGFSVQLGEVKAHRPPLQVSGADQSAASAFSSGGKKRQVDKAS